MLLDARLLPRVAGGHLLFVNHDLEQLRVRATIQKLLNSMQQSLGSRPSSPHLLLAVHSQAVERQSCLVLSNHPT